MLPTGVELSENWTGVEAQVEAVFPGKVNSATGGFAAVTVNTGDDTE